MSKDIFLITDICLTIGVFGCSSYSSDRRNTSNTSRLFLDSPAIKKLLHKRKVQ